MRYISLFIFFIFTSSASAANLITNGDFESGNTGLSSDYNFGSIGTDAGYYSIITDPNLQNGAAASYGDSTTGSGNMMAVNGSLVPNTLVWGQSVDVDENMDFDFSMNISSWFSASIASLSLVSNGELVGEFSAPTDVGIWMPINFVINSGVNTQLALEIFSLSTASTGNDFALDDISLAPVPLPASFWLFGTGIATFIGFRRKRVAQCLKRA